MPFFQRERKRSNGYSGDILYSIGDIPADTEVTLWILKDAECIHLQSDAGNIQIPYLRIIKFEADTEPRIREGISRIPAEALADIPESVDDAGSEDKRETRLMYSRWIGELLFVDEDGILQSIYMMEKKRSGYYLDNVKSIQAMGMERFVEDLLSDSE